ncbi:TlpA family protein disulfide reductase [Sphingobacterium zeae]|uniref:TlpA family protein disulfide reductase n=1 Tax=Sphingobacterium zeae TaxID=1776859 RepID=UPI00360A8934
MKILSIICILVLWSIVCQSQTKINGFIKDAISNPKQLVLTVYDPLSISQPQIIEDTIQTINGYFNFAVEIQKEMMVGLELDGNSIFFPGTFELLISPNDSLNIVIPNSKNLGILNLEISGKGVEKVDLKKNIIRKVLAIYKTDPRYEDQSLKFKFLTTDKKLNVIDSICNIYNGISYRYGSMIKAEQYANILKGLFISLMRSEDDSMNDYFKKFIVQKKRLKPFLENENIYYAGGTLLSEFMFLNEFKNPFMPVDDSYMTDNAKAYCKLIIKYFGKQTQVKNYLLSNFMISYLNSQVFTKSSEELYNFYLKNTTENNPFLTEVSNVYNRSQQSLRVGSPFFNFSLVDTVGKLHTLSDFKGKVLIIDFWFTGCSGCRQMAPLLDVIEQTIDIQDVKFVSINVDKKDMWLKGIGQYSSKRSLQLYTMEQKFHHPMIEALNIVGYPALFIVDRNGNFAGIPPDPRTKKNEFINYIKNEVAK